MERNIFQTEDTNAQFQRNVFKGKLTFSNTVFNLNKLKQT